MNHRKIEILSAVICLLLLLTAPFLGLALAGEPLYRYLEFPPHTLYIFHAPFSLPVFIGYALFIICTTAPFVFRAQTAGSVGVEDEESLHGFPQWGYLGLFLMLLFWTIAWTRIPLFSFIQSHTFFPLWLGYIISANALLVQRTGSCPLTTQPHRFLFLFPVSALFWWVFEYLNRFTQNWAYVNVEQYSALEYFLLATLSFSTVLPAVYTTKALLARIPLLNTPYQSFFVVSTKRPRLWAWIVLLLTTLLLLALGIFPNLLFSLLWLAPLALLISVQSLFSRQNMLAPLAQGDWREIVQWAVSALCCGFFWELWNLYSYAKWIYRIPYVQALHVFEMPLL